MDTLPALKQIEGRLAVSGDRLAALKGKLEDLQFRAQRMANAAKNNMPHNDNMFGYDLQHFRRDVRAYGQELLALPGALESIERTAAYEAPAVKHATDVMRQCTRLVQLLKATHECALLAHQCIRATDHKVEAWYMAQEVEELALKAQGLPSTANKIIVAVSTPVRGAAPPAAPPA